MLNRKNLYVSWIDAFKGIAICGVVIETHFSRIAKAHNIKIQKKDPTISDYNDKFKENSLYDTTTWRFRS